MAKQKLIIDGQIFQTAAKDRGMGRYSTCLLQALLTTQTVYAEIEIVLTQNLPTSDNVLRELRASFQGAKLHLLDLRTTKRGKIEDVFEHNRAVLTDYVQNEVAKGFAVDYLIPALFQEPVAAVFPAQARKFLIFYDLIPFLYHRRYTPVMNFKNYLKRFTHLFEAELIFTISQTVANDLHIYLGLPLSRLVRIDGAAIKSNKPPHKPPVNLPEKFILMPTSDDPRKNNLRAVLGFEEFRRSSADTAANKLVITSRIHRREKEYLQLFSKDLIFTGNLPEEQLEWLYENCAAVLFTPEYEGLGLPILEAVGFNKAVVCSSISVFEEIAEGAFAYCDHENPSSIAEALGAALTRKPQLAAYKTITAHYSWPKTAERLLAGIQNYQPATPKNRPHIAIFTPSPDESSVTAKLVAQAHAVLSEHFTIDYYSDGVSPPALAQPHFLNYVAPVYPAESFGVRNYRDYAAVIYHIDNDSHYLQAIKHALYLPGYVVLHSTDLATAYQGLVKAGLMPVERLQLEERLDSLVKHPAASHLTTVLNNQLGVLTFSNQAREAATGLVADGAIAMKANLPSFTAGQAASKTKAAGKITIGILGSIGDAKNVELVETLAAEPGLYNTAIWLIDFDESSVESVERFNLYDNVSVLSNPTDFEFQTALSRLDIFIDRSPGYEKLPSVPALEAMGHSLVLVVDESGWGSELPAGTVLRVTNGPALLEQLQLLIKNPERIRSIGEQASHYITEHCSREQYAASLHQLLDHQPSTQNLNWKLAQKLKTGQSTSARQYLKFIKGSK